MTNDGYDEGEDGALKEKMNIPPAFPLVYILFK